MDEIKKLRGEHILNIHVSYELKSRLRELAGRYDRTTADIVRGVLKIGIPIMESLTQAEEIMVKEYIELFRKLRRARRIKD